MIYYCPNCKNYWYESYGQRVKFLLSCLSLPAIETCEVCQPEI